MNDKVWIILFAYVIDTKCVNANSFSYDQEYHTEQKTWQAASDECGSNGLEFNEKVLTKNDALVDTEFWIGMAIYRVISPWIEVLGCSVVPDGEEVTKSPSIVLCQNQCQSYQFFSYSESTGNCFCQHYKSSLFNIKGCIATNESKYSFIYKAYTEHVSDNGDGKCTTLLCRSGDNGLKSSNCTGDYSRTSKCSTYDGHESAWGESYSTSRKKCLERFQLLLSPETYCKTNNHSSEGINLWTNVFRAETEAKLTKAEAGTKERLYCLAGSFTEQNAKKVLNLTRRDCSDKLYFACRIDTSSTTTAEYSIVSVEIPEKVESTKLVSGVQDVKPGAASSTTQSQIIIATQKMKKDSSGSFNIGPVIGGIVAAVIFVALLLVVISCKLRSCGFFKTTSKDKQQVSFSTAVSEHSQNAEVRTSVTPTANESYGLAPITSNNTYAVVNKIKKDGLQIIEDNYTETSFGEYDRLNSVSKRQTDSNTNVYDSHAGIRNESDPTYDSSNHGGRKLRLDNDVYDHTDTLSTDGSDYGYSSKFKSEVRNENDVYDKAV